MDDEEKLIGLNRVECGKMNLQFKENRINRIAFLGRPVGSLIPPQNITSAERQLEGFNWRIGEKPTLGQTTWAEAAPDIPKKEERPDSKKVLNKAVKPLKTK